LGHEAGKETQQDAERVGDLHGTRHTHQAVQNR